MFGISPLGWVHTLGSLPAIPAAVYMFARHGRIVPRSAPGTVYLVSMLIGAATAVTVAHQTASYGIAAATLAMLFIGYGAERVIRSERPRRYVETIALTLSAFLLMVPTVTETLRRVPDGDPWVTRLDSPLLLGAQGSLLALLVVGLTLQIVFLRRRTARSGSITPPRADRAVRQA